MILDDILDRIALRARQGGTPVAIFDLDFTLFDNSPRTWAILMHLASRTGAPLDGWFQRLLALAPGELPYDHGSCLGLMGVTDVGRVTELKREIGDLFFSSKFLDRDAPIPGGREFVAEALHRGATIVYLTGRDRLGMYAGTVASLQAHQFPLGHPRVELIMKPDQVTRDTVFKVGLRKQIAQLGEIVGFFDNEPGNVNAFHEAFTTCTSVLLDTKCSSDAPDLGPGLTRVPDFRGFKGWVRP